MWGLQNGDDGTDNMTFGSDKWGLITTVSFCRGLHEQHRDIEMFEGRAGVFYYFRQGMAVSFEFHANVFQNSQKYDGYDSGKSFVSLGNIAVPGKPFEKSPRV